MDWEPRVGMRVVCINDKGWNGTAYSFPKKGDICTIRGFSRSLFGEWILLEEHRTHEIFPSSGHERGFQNNRFKPLRERKTDISIFTALLTKAPTPEKEPA